MTSIAKCPTHGLWRKSASILLIGPSKHGRPAVLMVKRSAKAQFMPNNLVFPGGLCETTDFSLLWQETYPELKNFSVNPNATYPDIFVNDSTPPSQQLKELSPHVGFRIAAIRELVEEVGLFLDRKSGSVKTIADDVRHEIHQRPERFCEIVNNMNMIPDIWALHDWSTWLTPVGLKHSSRRYDTQFYVVVLDNIDDLRPSSDNKEVSTVEFWNVRDVLSAGRSGKVLIAPPQMYELARLLNFNTVDQLRVYAQLRDNMGTERIFPVTVICSDGVVRVFPGDSLYPDTPDTKGTGPPIKLNITVKECMKMHPKHHRIAMVKGEYPAMHINIQLNLQQMAPVVTNSQKSFL